MIEVKGVVPVPAGFRPVRALGPLRWLIKLPDLVVLGLPLVMVAVAVRVADGVGFLLFMTVLIGIVVWIVANSIVRRVAAGQWRKSPTWPLANDWHLDDGGVTITDGAFKLTMKWEAIIAVREERDRFLFHGTPVSANALPIQFLDAGRNQIGDIRALVAKVTAEGRLGRGVD
ncbi:YcxB family protein [Brevundimonas lenta]|uniref:YcxB-like protein domain-containing protein n=1 Tax=Brevundimonas lenta TaxID=424796 RepID=A0A7W6JAY5_9CAUL|nr:YcxB family protein [Brevundimonas lenta]MBB4081786.1 hypothetical protein [Brevundimonas lenta]